MLVSSPSRATLHPVSQISVYQHGSRALQDGFFIAYFIFDSVLSFSILFIMVLTTARGLSILTVALFCVLLLCSKDYTAQLFQSEPRSGLKFTNKSAHGLFTASPRKHLSPPSTTKFDIKAAPPKVILVAMAVAVSKDSVFWRSLQTHEAYARRWNYRSHILAETLAAEEPWSKFQEFGYSKMLYLQSLVIHEMAKPAKERAEWIV